VRPLSDAATWWHNAVIYQLYPLSYADGDGDGTGDLGGIIQRLDHLTDTLGVDAVWLSPFYPSPLADHGYDVADYTDVDPRFGDLANFDRLVDEAHRRGLRVIVDWVPNHTSDQHPWFVQSRSSADNPRRDWYYWRDPKPDGSPPNNWVSSVRGSAWEYDEASGQYYLHSYLPQQPDLNWRNPAVRAAMLDVLRFWLDRGVDGFRIDVAHRIMKDPQLRDNPTNPDRISDYYKPINDEYLSQRHIHDRAHPDVHGVYRQIRALLDGYDGDRMAMGEIHLADLADWAAFYGTQSDELHLALNFWLTGAAWTPTAIREAVEAVEAALPQGAAPTLVLGNHDYHRLASRIGQAQARIAAMLLLTLRGAPLIFQGDEIGLTDVAVPEDRRRDRFGEPGGRWSRDGARTPMQWTSGPHAGFSPAHTEQTWLPLSPDYERNNVQAQLDDPASLLWLYRRLIAYRTASPALLDGSYASVGGVPHACLAYHRKAGSDAVFVALNFGDEPQEVDLPGAGVVALSTAGTRNETVEGSVRLAANEGVCVELS
jgi:glycosidase